MNCEEIHGRQAAGWKAKTVAIAPAVALAKAVQLTFVRVRLSMFIIFCENINNGPEGLNKLLR